MNLQPRTKSASPLQVLDPRLLGRPVHLLRGFADRLKADLSELFIGSLNRRYRATFQIGEVTMVRTDPNPMVVDDLRWTTLSASAGRIGFCMDRSVLMTVLHYRYGLQDVRAKDEARADNQMPATATEERLAITLGLQLINILALRVDTPETGFEHEISPPHDFAPVPSAVPRAGSWTLSVVIRELTNEVEGLIRFRLDEAWMHRLLRNLAPQRDKGAVAGAAGMQPVGAQLPLMIVARLLEQDMPLGSLMDLRVGDVIPVRLGAADVLVEDARLFEATVAEHQGKLCLTAFEDIE